MEQIAKAGFYNSWYELAQRLNEADRLAFYDAIFSYYFDGIEPEENSAVYNYFVMAKPIIEKDITDKLNGAKGGKNKGVNTPLDTPLNSKVKVKVNVEREKSNEKRVMSKGKGEITETFTNNFLDINNYFSIAGFNATPGTKKEIKKSLEEDGLNADFLDYVLNNIKVKYPNASTEELNALFIDAVLNWDNLRKTYRRSCKSKQKTEAKEKINIMLTAPTSCTFCGAELEAGALNNTVECKHCRENGQRTWWEYEQGKWTCNR